MKLVKHKNKKNAAVKEVIQFVLESNGIQYAYNKMLEFQQKALAILDEFPDNEAKKALIGLVNYTVDRKK